MRVKVFSKSLFKKVRPHVKDLPKYVPERLLLAAHYFLIILRNSKYFCNTFSRGWEFLSYEIELQNRVTQNDVTIRVTNLKSKNKTLHFELLTRRFNFYFSTYELLTQC